MQNPPPSSPSLPTEEVGIPRPKPTLRESLLGLDLDILQELEAFRRWQQSQTLSREQLNSGTVPGGDLVEDLDEEENRFRLPTLSSTAMLLLVWLASCGGLIIGIWWLFSPGSPNQVRRPLPQPTPTFVVIDLIELPLIPPVDLATLPIIPWIDLATLPLIPESSLELALATPTPTPTAEPTPLPTATAVAVVMPVIQAPVAPDQLDALPPNKTEGTFLVVVSYDDAASLAAVKAEAPTAFVKTIAGQRYVQVASFKQLDYARFLADDLRQKGFNALISRL